MAEDQLKTEGETERIWNESTRGTAHARCLEAKPERTD